MTSFLGLKGEPPKFCREENLKVLASVWKMTVNFSSIYGTFLSYFLEAFDRYSL